MALEKEGVLLLFLHPCTLGAIILFKNVDQSKGNVVDEKVENVKNDW